MSGEREDPGRLVLVGGRDRDGPTITVVILRPGSLAEAEVAPDETVQGAVLSVGQALEVAATLLAWVAKVRPGGDDAH